MVKCLLISALAASFACFVQGQSCVTPSGANGNCVSLYDCEPLVAILRKPSRTPQEVQLLQQSQCGSEGNTPKVCCPDDSCQTPQGPGQCIHIESCPHLAAILQPPVSRESITYVQSLRCKGGQFNVCCGPPPAPKPVVPTPVPDPVPNPFPNPVPDPNGQCTLTHTPLDPATKCCGRDDLSSDRIFGGNVTGIDEYPWLVVIEYFRGNDVKLLCGGVLISGRYVLTAAHCVRGPVLNSGTPRGVRLGEFDTKNEGQDCARTAGGGTDCTDGAISIPIEQIIAHPQYDSRNAASRHDIALIRLRNMAPYTAFIRPICMPTKDYQSINEDSGLWVAGWGQVNETHLNSNLKVHVNVPFVPMQICQPVYTVPGRKVQLWQGQLCAGGQLGRDSCRGDSGGPLMYNRGRFFELIGIVSFGPKQCGTENVPGVYTKVFQYLPWIQSQIQP